MYGAYSMFGVLCVYSVKGVHNELGNPPAIVGRHRYLVKAESVLVNDFTNKSSTNKALYLVKYNGLIGHHELALDISTKSVLIKAISLIFMGYFTP